MTLSDPMSKARAAAAAACLLICCRPIEHQIGNELDLPGPDAGGAGVVAGAGGAGAGGGAEPNSPRDCAPASCPLEVKFLYVVSGTRSQFVRRVVTDEQGNYYFAGEYEGSATFPDRVYEETGAHIPAFLGSLSPGGTARWLFNMGSLNEQRVEALAFAPTGPVLSLGFTNRFSVSGLQLSQETGNGALGILTFDSDGHGLWGTALRNVPGTDLAPITGRGLLAADAGVTLIGEHEQSLEMDPLSLVAPGEGKPFGYYLDLSPSGTGRSIKPSGAHQRWNAAAPLSNGSIVVGEVTSPSGSDILLNWLNAQGDVLLSRRFGGDGEDAALGVFSGEGDVVYVTGYVSSPLSLGGAELPHAGLKDAFLVSYAKDGTQLWSKTFGSASDDWGVAVRSRQGGRLVLVGMQGDAVDFGGGPLGAFSNAFFVATFTARGDAESAQTFALNGGQATDLAVAPDGSLAVAGYWDGGLKLAGRTYSSSTGTDGFLAKLHFR